MNESEQKSSSIKERKDKIRKRYSGSNTEGITVIPAAEVADLYEDTTHKRVAVYARVSTDSENQTSSYELQKSYYESMVEKHPNWDLVDIYADEGITGTSLLHREACNRMIEDCKKGMIDLVITKNVSRFARNVVDCIQISRDLKELNPRVGILFETENIYTLNDNSEMQLSFIATLAQEESHAKSQSMNRSYHMRFEKGIFLTPVLLGYDHDEDGDLIINEDEAKTVRLIFLLYMYGKTCNEIAEILTELGRTTKLGNEVWNAGSISGILRNERYCGDVLAQKTYTPNYLNHKSVKNKNERTKYYKKENHQPIVSREDYILVQRMMDQAKYGFRKPVPELNVVSSGVLKGFVQINPYWMGFKEDDYLNACHSVLSDSDYLNPIIVIKKLKGDAKLKDYQVTRGQFAPTTYKISANVSYNRIRFSSKTIEALENKTKVELLYHPLLSLLVVRESLTDSKHSIRWATYDGKKFRPNHIKGNSFCPILYSLNNWNPEYKYTLSGYVKEQAGERIILFYADEPEIRIRDETGERIMFKADWEDRFGDYYHEYLAKSESVFTPDKEWFVNSPGVLANTPDFELKKEHEIAFELKTLIKELGYKGGELIE